MQFKKETRKIQLLNIQIDKNDASNPLKNKKK